MSQLAIFMSKDSGEILSMARTGAGEYRVRYIPQHSGPFSFEVKLLGEALPGSPYTPNVLQCAMERLFVLPAKFGLEVCTEDTPGKGLRVNNVKIGGASHRAGIQVSEYLKEFDGHYMSSNAFFEDALLNKTPGDQVSVQVIDKSGKAERTVLLVIGTPKMSLDEVIALRIEAHAENETLWEDMCFDRKGFKALFPNAGKRVVEKGVTHKYVVPAKGQAAAQPTEVRRPSAVRQAATPAPPPAVARSAVPAAAKGSHGQGGPFEQAALSAGRKQSGTSAARYAGLH